MATKKPRISVNKLGEFMTAQSARQKRIVKDQCAIRPLGFKAFRYTEVRAACVKYFSENFDLSIIDKSIDDLSKRKITNDYDIIYQKTSIESLDEIKKIDVSQFRGLSFSGFNGSGLVEIAGVDVSVCPDLLIRAEIKKKNVIGAVKFHYKKSGPLEFDAQIAVATILNQFLNNGVKAEDETAVHTLSYSIDIFGETIVSAPKAQVKILSNAKASCELYKLIWESLTIPPTPSAPLIL